MAWEKRTIASQLPDDFTDLADSAATLSGNLETAVDILKAALLVAKAFVTTNIDPFSTLANVIITEVETVIDDFFATGFSVLVITPNDIEAERRDDPIWQPNNVYGIGDAVVPIVGANTFFYKTTVAGKSGVIRPNFPISAGATVVDGEVTWTAFSIKNVDLFGIPTMTPDRALSEAVKSFDDVGDTRRPQFSDSATVTGFGILVTAVSIDELVTKLKGLKSLLNLNGIAFYLNQAERAQATPPAPVPSVIPNWKTTKLADIPGFSDLHRSLKGFLNQFRGYLVTGDAFLDDFLDSVENKVNAIARAVDELNNAIDKAVGGIGATGAYWLDIPKAVGGNDYLKAQIPDTTLSALTVNNYTAMILFVAGGPSTDGLDNFKSVFA